MKYNFNEDKYAEMVKQCNNEPTKYIIVDTGETFEVQEIQYDLTEEKEKMYTTLLRRYKMELSDTLDPAQLQAYTMVLADIDESIDVIAPNGEPKQYTQDEFTDLLNAELQKRNDLLLKYKTLYDKVKNAKKVEDVHGVKW